MIVERKKLLEMLELTGKNSGSMPILGSVLLEQKGNELNLKWSNLEESIQINVPTIQIHEKDIALAVPKKALEESVKMLKEDKINIDIDDEINQVKISDGKIETIIKNCFPVDEFPELPKKIQSIAEEIKASIFLEGLKKVSFAVFNERRWNAKPQLQGICIESSKDGLDFVATDGKQLANWHLSDKFATEFRFLLPMNAVATLSKLLQKRKEDNLKIRKDKEHVQFELDNIRETVHLEDLEFPGWRKVISIDTNYEQVIVDKKEFTNILKNASKMKATSKFIIEFASQKLMIETENSERKIKETIVYWGDANITFFLNPIALNQGIRQTVDSELELLFKDKEDSMQIEEGNYRYVLMPIQSGE